MVPNFVDTEKFRPDVKSSMRMELGIPQDAFVVLTVAAIKKSHKRIGHLINEISRIGLEKNVYLVVAGSVTDDTLSPEGLGKEKLGDMIRFLKDLPHERMPEVYKCADLFVLPSLFEMFGIVFLEAMASGVPSIGHKHPVIEWVIGASGECIDMTKQGESAKTIKKCMNNELRAAVSGNARKHVIKNFAKGVVAKQITDMYEAVLNDK